MLLCLINRVDPMRELWVRINSVDIPFGPIEFAMVTGLIFGHGIDMSIYVDYLEMP